MIASIPQFARIASMPRLTRAFGVLVLAALLPSALAAQSVRGTVTDPETGGPLWGAVVVLLDGEEGEVRAAGAIADEAGRYSIRVPAAGTYRLRLERIGYRSITTAPFHLDEGEAATRDLSASVQPVALQEIRVAGEARCRGLGQGDPEAYLLWEETRKALFATVLTADLERYRFDAALYRRRLDPRRLRVEEEERRQAEGYGRHPFRSISAARLAEGGYVQETPDGTMYYAPDAQILLSESFLDHHCFLVRQGEAEGEEGLLGLGFEPVRDRDVPEVAGTLWLDPETAQLRHLDYRYENVDLPIQSDEIGGRLEFERLPSGGWVVRNWRIRMPVVGLERRRSVRPLTGETVERQSPYLAAFVDEGGELTEVRQPDGEPVRRYGRASLEGRVVDAEGRPLSGARVRLAGTPFQADARLDGSFLLEELPAGSYRATFRHPDLDLLDYAPEGVPVRLEEGARAEVRLALRPWEELVPAACEDRWIGEGDAGSEGVLLGRVRAGPERAPVPAATVEIAWESLRLDRPVRARGVHSHTVVTRTDSVGIYRVCGLPAARTVTVRARADDRTSRAVRIAIPGEGCGTGECGVPLGRPLDGGRASGFAVLPRERFARADLVLEGPQR